MDSKVKILTTVLIVFFIVSVSAKYYKFSVVQDYYVSAEISCDVSTESCFVWDCDLADEECDQTPYKYIWKHASEVPECDPRIDECDELQCGAEDDCEITYCSSETLSEEEFCYSAENEQ